MNQKMLVACAARAGSAETQRTALQALPPAIFGVQMQALEGSAAKREARAKVTQAVRALLTPRDEAFFAGRIEPAALSHFERLAVRMVKLAGDEQRDGGLIRRRADGLAPQLH